jgi:hypothetical protein
MCGKHVKGFVTVNGLGYWIRRHKKPEGMNCYGHLRTNHKRATKGTTK